MQGIKSKSFDQDNKAVCIKIFDRFTNASLDRITGMGACKVQLEDKLLTLQDSNATKEEMGHVREMLGLIKRELRSEEVLRNQSQKLWHGKCAHLV